jgi:NADH-quinone oxidoreductase subunit I
MNVVKDTVSIVTELLRGLWVTLIHMGRKPTTQMYPEQKPKLPPRFRGLHQLQRHPDGLEKCIGCSLCAAACPADAIMVIAGENTPENRVSPGERHAVVYEINMIRCIFCGYCEEACPTGAIVLKRNFELAASDRQHYVFDKQMLLGSPAE